MIKSILKVLGILLLLLVLYGVYNFKLIKRVYHSITLFDEGVIVQNFQNMADIADVSVLEPATQPYQWPIRKDYQLIDTFYFGDSLFTIEEYFDHTITEGFMVIHQDTVIFEEYYNDLQPDETHISWSVAKSFVSTMIGILHDEGKFQLMDPITKYLPELKGTGYDGVPIKYILQMSSGVGYNEDYGDFNSDINRFGRAFAAGSPLIDFTKSLKRAREPGTFNHYVSIDTQVLGFLIKKLSGKSVTDFMRERIWEPMGMEHRGEWIVDNTGMEMVLGGLNASLRDFAKLGVLFLNEGKFNGKQIVSPEWVKMATTPDAPHLMPNQTELSSNHHGYGFQWWVPQYDEGDFFAVGIYNQYVYVQPSKDLVITKLSANHHFKTQKQITKDIHLSMFKAFARDFEQAIVEPLKQE